MYLRLLVCETYTTLAPIEIRSSGSVPAGRRGRKMTNQPTYNEDTCSSLHQYSTDTVTVTDTLSGQ